MKRKAVSCLLILAAIMTLTLTIPTLAAENPDNTIQEATTTGSQGATITYEQDSAFTVTIPKTITLDQNKSATYDVKVKGDIAGNETVTVTPDATLQLTDSNGKAAVTGTITQDVTEFAADQVNLPDGGSTTGNIVANDLTSGDWSGNFEFAIEVEKKGEDITLTSDNLATYGISTKGDVEIPKYVTDSDGTKHKVVGLKNYVFKGCKGLTSITMPNSVTSIGIGAFEGCKGLTSITIPNSVTSIRAEAFYNCSGLTSITIPDSATSIGTSAFQGCTGLTSITIPNSVTSIGIEAFSGCSGLTSITIPDNVTSIGNSAFYGCSGLKSITIPNSVTNIGDCAFGDCTKLASVTYKGQTYTSKSALTATLKNNVTVYENSFDGTALTN